ncbi:hypothetical protein INR49_000230 [Caranx melampygus]|nr:hypothetical protein INR49_000230 [Caranx melampygus]
MNWVRHRTEDEQPITGRGGDDTSPSGGGGGGGRLPNAQCLTHLHPVTAPATETGSELSESVSQQAEASLNA